MQGIKMDQDEVNLNIFIIFFTFQNLLQHGIHLNQEIYASRYCWIAAIISARMASSASGREISALAATSSA